MGFFPILQNGKKIPREKLNLWIEPYNFFSAICMALSKDWRLKTHILFFIIFPMGKKSHLMIWEKNPVGIFKIPTGKKFFPRDF